MIYYMRKKFNFKFMRKEYEIDKEMNQDIKKLLILIKLFLIQS